MKKQFLIFDIGGTFVKWAITTADYKIIESSKWSFDGKKDGQKILIKDLGTKIKEIEAKTQILAIGISVAGTIDPISKKIVGENINIKGMANTDFKKELSIYTNKPIIIENDANAATLGEVASSKFEKYKNILMITLGTGIGGGIIINKKIFWGSSGMAGELGQAYYKEQRWEYYHSAIGLIRLVKDQLNIELSTYEILESKDKQIKSIVDQWYDGIAAMIATAITFMNFDAIIIGGGISESKFFNINLINKKIKKHLALKQLHNTFEIFIASQGNTAAIIGMTKSINQSLFSE